MSVLTKYGLRSILTARIPLYPGKLKAVKLLTLADY